ncbi:MAG TPA: hypothetical protein VLJ16_14330, partial [Acidobacteriota bacterium]|nr:hypothetical protein [Acidobacteriota bacterium]
MRAFRSSVLVATAGLAVILSGCSGNTTSRALDSIRPGDMKFPLEFLGSPEFRGRSTPSAELDIAAEYIALTAERVGLKPVMPDGSYFQEVPVEVTTVVPAASRLLLSAGRDERTFTFPEDVTVGRGFETGRAKGGLVFLGLGVSAPDLGWDDLKGVELKGRVAVVLDATINGDHPLKPTENRRLIMGRATALRARGAAAVIMIINEEREARLA